MVPKSGHVTITKIENLHFLFQKSGVTRHLWRFQHATVLERSTEVGFSLILLIYKLVYISIPGMGNALEKFAVKFAKNLTTLRH